ncbi:MAG: hypothetical protein ACYDBJ_02080 [Aggregatilineales bacterium]
MRIKQLSNRIRSPGWLCAALIMGLAGACGDTAASPTPAPTNTPGITSTDGTLCPSVMVDTWLKYSFYNTKSFVNLMNASVSIKSEQALTVATQLGQFEGRVMATQAPACATAEKQAIQQMMDGVMQAFKVYAAVPALTLKNSSALALANTQYAQILKMQQDLINSLTAQLGHP